MIFLKNHVQVVQQNEEAEKLAGTHVMGAAALMRTALLGPVVPPTAVRSFLQLCFSLVSLSCQPATAISRLNWNAFPAVHPIPPSEEEPARIFH
jgi:hypothetical protein